mmetsp:Transcript_19994/g.17066  ORF Transcript_19994/g.17066 Transcript_19994/m.17066 type:complete len:86 (+) Transcript_19994:369-626(+)
MWPGVKDIKSLDEFDKDDVRYILSAEGEIIGLGAMGCSSKELKEKGPTGTAVLVLHLMDDKLWQFGPKKVLPPLGTSDAGDQKGE